MAAPLEAPPSLGRKRPRKQRAEATLRTSYWAAESRGQSGFCAAQHFPAALRHAVANRPRPERGCRDLRGRMMLCLSTNLALMAVRCSLGCSWPPWPCWRWSGAPRVRAGSACVSGGEPRSYKLVAPPGDDGAPRPLVIALHGWLGTPEQMARMSGLSSAAAQTRVRRRLPGGRLALLGDRPVQPPRRH